MVFNLLYFLPSAFRISALQIYDFPIINGAILI